MSTKTADYLGQFVDVAAVSIKQAFFFAGNRQWAEGPDGPAGIVEYYQRGAGPPGDHRLWCGCQIYGGLFRHGDSGRTIREKMEKHVCSEQTQS